MTVRIASIVLWALLATVPGPASAQAAPTGDWQLELGRLRDARVLRLWTVGPQVLALDAADGLTAIDPDTGRVRWFVQLPDALAQPPVDAPLLALACGTDKLVIDADTGARVFEQRSADAAAATPACDGKRLYVPSLRGDRLVAIDMQTGRTSWTSLMPAHFTTPLLLSGSAGGATLVFGTQDGILRGLPAGNTVPDHELWVLRTGPLVGHPVLHGEHVLVVGERRAIWSVEAASGRIAWKSLPGDVPITGPILAGDAVVVGTQRGLVALDLATGAERWQVETWDRPLAATADAVLVQRKQGCFLRSTSDGAVLDGAAPREGSCGTTDRLIEPADGGRLVAWKSTGP